MECLHCFTKKNIGMGGDITREVLRFLNGGAMPENWNDTVIALIPKVPNPQKVTELGLSASAMLFTS